ncbi:hypothetical protein ABZ671_31555 [Micromonospora sp. NPDC006766]|uniref:NACHT domain-containing protein n=1 Tax=Micromonospora sp. NPDC006766 TaxID=3154778 RepID=UPI0033FD3BDE
MTYADAVQLLGAGDSPFISALGRLSGVGAAGLSAATLSAVDLFALRDEVVDWGNKAVRGLHERLSGLGRYDRTQRLVAAHTVIVISSFFEAFDETLTTMHVNPARLEITLAEQVALGARTAAEFERCGILSALVDNQVPLPTPLVPFELLRGQLDAYYRDLMGSVGTFISNLVGGEDAIQGIDAYLVGWQPRIDVAGAALRRYEIAYRSLAAEVPEFAIWAAMTDAAAGRATTQRIGTALGQQLAELTTGLAGVRTLLADLTTGNTAARRIDLASRYRLALDQPILDIGDLPDGVTMPPTTALYVNPRARIRAAKQGSPVAAETWWADALAITDLQPFLAGYLTGPEAVTSPLLVLGQPGSGKSLLSRVLAANLPPEDFLAVRVELRSVAADAPVQDQIESAVYQAVGQPVNWPELVRSADGALPVVMLDGYDELLQASGANRANYLEQVRDFQRREAELGRPLVVLVTSRTVVADRVRVPEGSIVLRIEPFDETQIRRWLDAWATTNTAGLARRSLEPLATPVALRYRELAEQPLLLLMLSLYDARDNALQRAADGFDRAELYERLFTDFARREIGKREPAAPTDGERVAVSREIRRLELIALAMFTRGAQIITEEQLDADLHELLGDDRVEPARPDGYQRALTAAQLLVGRFFFIHESRAREETDAPERSFEFLHATFGEFLLARRVVGTLVDLAKEQAHQARRDYPAALDAGPLYAWLSFAVLTGRAPVVEFSRVLLSRLPHDIRDQCHALLLVLLRDAGFPHPTWSLANYQPVRQAVSARHAAFTANLVTLVVLVRPNGVNPARLFPPDQGLSWRSHALLWESQLPSDGWRSLWQTMRMTYRLCEDLVGSGEDPEHEVMVAEWYEGHLVLEGGAVVKLSESLPIGPLERLFNEDAPGELYRELSFSAESRVGTWLREAAFRADGGPTTVLTHSLAPFWRHVGTDRVQFYAPASPGTDAAALLELLLAPRGSKSASHGHLAAAYAICLRLFRNNDRVQALIMCTIEEDVVHLDPAHILVALSTAVEYRPVDHHSYWILHSDRVARILALVHARQGERRQIQAVYSAYQRAIRELNNPADEPFEVEARSAFTQLGISFPEYLRHVP